MKKLIFLIILLIGVNTHAQIYSNNSWNKEVCIKSDNWKLLALMGGSIILDAVGDGLNDNGEKEWGHLCNAASIGCLLAIPLTVDIEWKDAGGYLVGYILLRFGMFDPIYNSVRGLPLGYTGNTSYYDRMWQKFKAPEDIKAVTNVLAFSVGITVTLRYK